MQIFGYALVLAGLYGLYEAYIWPGILVLAAGGFMAKRFYLSFRSLGVLAFIGALAWGFHHQFNLLIIGLVIIGFFLGMLSPRHGSDANEWGFDFDINWGDSGDSGSDGGGD